MRRIAVLVLLWGGLLAGDARALDLSNGRLTTGPLGSKRSETKFLPGDVLFLTPEDDPADTLRPRLAFRRIKIRPCGAARLWPGLGSPRLR